MTTIQYDGSLVSCCVCDEEIELPADACPNCEASIDEDDVRGQLEDQAEPPEWA